MYMLSARLFQPLLTTNIKAGNFKSVIKKHGRLVIVSIIKQLFQDNCVYFYGVLFMQFYLFKSLFT